MFTLNIGEIWKIPSPPTDRNCPTDNSSMNIGTYNFNIEQLILFLVTAQWEFGWPTLTPTFLEAKTEVKVDYLRQIEVHHGIFLWILK